MFRKVFSNRFWVISFGALILFVLSLYTFLPDFLEYEYYRRGLKESGFTSKTLDMDGSSFSYLEGGEGPLVLFIHGFQGGKEYWLHYGKKLFSRYRVIAVDLPGHGETTFVPEKYGLQTMADSIHLFVQKKGFANFHLVGVSMGGGVAMAYAAKYPSEVESLALLNPIGVATQQKSKVQKMLEKGNNPFFPKTVEELDQLFVFLVGKPLRIGNYFKWHILRKLITRYKIYEKCFADFMKDLPLDDLLPKIQVRTLLLIGGADQVIHPSAGKVYQQKMAKAKLQFLAGAHHSFIGPFFDEVVVHLQKFWEKQEQKAVQ